MEGHIDFPITLNMLPYTVKKDKERVDTSKYVYDLSTVVVHQGSMDSGHYYSYTRLAGDKVRAYAKDESNMCSKSNTDHL